MSNSEMEASKYIVMVHLGHLNKPYKLSQWIQLIPHYKKQYLISPNDNDDSKHIDNDTQPDDATTHADDIRICDQLSEFLFRNQITGQHLMVNFTKTDFEALITMATNNTPYHQRYAWIWQCIERSKSNIGQADKLSWISNSWAHFQTITEHSERNKPHIATENDEPLPIASDPKPNVPIIPPNEDDKCTQINAKKAKPHATITKDTTLAKDTGALEPTQHNETVTNSSRCGCVIV
eukprot:545525_1